MTGLAPLSGQDGRSDDRPVAGDGGLQIERTALAWRRTAASFAVGAAVATRHLLARTVGGWACLAGVVAGLCLIVVMVVAFQRTAPMRRRSARRAAVTGLAAGVPAPGWMIAVAVLTSLAGLATAIAVLTGTS